MGAAPAGRCDRANTTRRGRCGRGILFLLVIGSVGGLLGAAPARSAHAGEAGYRPPVDAPIADPFRAPAHPFGPGNRGIEYATEPGSEVRAIGAGEVTFAGQVGGTLHVTVLHADGLRSTVSFLDSIGVRRGDTVTAGQTLGSAGSRTHLGVRSGEQYLDPAALFVGGRGAVRLVPTESAASSSVAAERAAIAEWMRQQASLFDRATDWLRDRADDAVVLAELLAANADPTRFVVDTGFELFDRLTSRPACTNPDTPSPRTTSRRIVVLVGGLGSTSHTAAVDDVDTESLGYEPADVYRFSYLGGRVPDVTDRHQGLASTSYGALDSQSDLVESAAELRDLVGALARIDPGIPIDVIAHSQGGVVTRLALDGLERTIQPGALGAVVTLGTPHQGADLATAAAAIRADRRAIRVFEAADRALGTGLDIDSPAIRQLAVGSAITEQMTQRGVPADVRLTSIAARGDLVVAANRTHVDGADNVTLPLVGPTAHTDLPGHATATREIGLAIAEWPPTCESSTDIVLDVVGGRLVSETQQQVSTSIVVGGLLTPG